MLTGSVVHRARAALGLGLTLLAAVLACDSSGPEAGTPVIVSLGPKQIPPNIGQIDLIVNGRNFVAGSEVLWNESARPTTVVSPYRLIATIFTADIRDTITAFVVVENSQGRSNRLRFIVADGAEPFGVSSTTPAGGEVNEGTLFVVRFNDDVEPSSLNDTTLTLTNSAGPVPATITYDRVERAATLTATLVPLEQYTLRLSDLVRTTSHAALWSSLAWDYSTPIAPEREVDQFGDSPSLALAGGDSPRIAYRFYGQPASLKVAQCPNTCAAGGWGSLALAGSGGGYVSLAITGGVTTHVVSEDGFGGNLAYIRGSGPPVIVDTAAGTWSAIAAEPGGRLHVVYHGSGLTFRHATCFGVCSTMGAWQRDTIDTDGSPGGWSAVAVDANANVHTVYFEAFNSDLRYAVCAAPCVGGSWDTVTIVTAGLVGIGSALVVDGGGGVHVSYFDETTDRVKYATCATACTTAGNWTTTTIEDVGESDADLSRRMGIALAPSGALEVTYMDNLPSSVRAASCAAACTDSTSWQTTLVSRRADYVGHETSLKIDAAGKRHVAWTGLGERILYTQY